ncbi:MAG TPA: hypothetical protein VG345_09540 [Bryobacteraceae bacterium]|nr:hypothetical protein [Bryobacteraceae bacterium]
MSKPNQPLSPQSLLEEEILVKHVFRGSSFAVVRLEELSEIGNLKADAVSCYRPVNAQELFAVEYIAVCQQRMLRGARVESGLFTTALDYCLEQDGRTFRPMSENMVGNGDIEITRAQNRNFAAGEGVHRMVKESNVWSILMRYQVNAERQYRRAVEDFERLKRLRPEMPNHPNVGAAPYVIDDIAPLKEINPLIRLETLRLEPEPCAAASSVETPNTPENDSPEDGTPLAPAAAATRNTQNPTSRIVGPAPAGGRLKVTPRGGRQEKKKPFASLPLRRSDNPRRRLVSKARGPACRPLGPPEPPFSG